MGGFILTLDYIEKKKQLTRKVVSCVEGPLGIANSSLFKPCSPGVHCGHNGGKQFFHRNIERQIYKRGLSLKKQSAN